MRGGLVVLCTTLVVPAPPAVCQEPAPPRVQSLRFEGNEALSDAALERAIATSGPPFLAGIPLLNAFANRPSFDPAAFRRDVLRIEALYRVRGFPTATVDTTVTRDGPLVGVTFVIHEGPPEIVRSLTFDGLDDVVSRRALLERLPLAPGAPLDRLDLEATTAVVAEQFRNRGFPFVQVTASTRRDSTRRAADVLIHVDRGPRATIDSIAVIGTHRIDRRVVLQSLTVAVGDRYRADALRASQLALYRSGLFSYAAVTLADTAPATRDTSITVMVRANVFEGPVRRIRVGGGYGTMDCFRTLGQLALNNVVGGGRIVELRASASKIGLGDPLQLERGPLCRAFRDEDASRLTINYRLSGTLREPLLFAPQMDGTLSLFDERHTEFQAYLRQSLGGQIALTRRLGSDALPLTLSYGLSWGKTVADPVTLCRYFRTCLVDDTQFFAEPRWRSVLGLSFVRDRTDALFNASTGSALTAEIHWASPLIGSDSLIQFARGVAAYASYHRLAPRTVLAWRVRVGAVLSPSFGFETAGGYTPPEDRFYLGGPNTVRGFTQNRLGPVVYVLDTVAVNAGTPDSTIRTSATGGNLGALVNVELRLPLPGGNRFRAAVFVDAGFVGDHLTELGDRLRITPGAGLRIATPLGAVRLDIGFNPYPPEAGPLYRQDGDALVAVADAYRPSASWLDHFRLHFSIGQAF